MTTPNLTAADKKALQDLHEKSLTRDGVSEQEQEVLNHARAAGDVGEESMPDTVMKFMRQNPLLPQVGTELAGEEIGRRVGGGLVDLLNPLKKASMAKTAAKTAGKTVGSLLGIVGGDISGQVLTGDPGQEIDLGQTQRATTFGAGGLGVSSLLEKFLGRRRKPLPPEKFEGGKAGQLTKPVMQRANERLVKANVASRLSNVLRNELMELIDGISSSIPGARKLMVKLQENIQGFYEARASEFGRIAVEKMPKIHLAKLTREMVVNAQELATRESTRNFRELDDLVESGVDLSFMNKGEHMSFVDAAKLMEKGTVKNIAEIRKRMKLAIKEHGHVIAKRLKLETAEGKKLAQSIKGTSMDTPSNRAFLKEFSKTGNKLNKLEEIGGDIDATVANLAERVDNALMFSKKNMPVLQEEFVRQVARRQPASFLDAFVKPNDPDSLRTAMGMLDAATRRNVRQHFIGGVDPLNKGGLLNQATVFAESGGVGELNGKLLINAIKQFEDGFGTRMSRAMFPGQGLEGLKELAQELIGFQGKGGSKQGATAAFLLLPSAVFGVTEAVVSGSIFAGMTVGLATSVGLLTIPVYYAYKFNNVKFVKKMTGLLPKRGESAQAAARRASLFVSQLTAQGIEAEFTPHDDVFEAVSGSGQHQLTQ